MPNFAPERFLCTYSVTLHSKHKLQRVI